VLFQLLHEGAAAQAGLLELLAEAQHALGGLARLLAVEQGGTFLEVTDQIRGRVEAQAQFLRFGVRRASMKG
jgi:hypothetical protein